MDNSGTKKMIPIQILEILRKYTDYSHRLKQKDISDYLLRDYNASYDKKAVKRNLEFLADAGFPVYSDEYDRADGGITTRGWYYESDFTDAELRILIDSILFAGIPEKQLKSLISKLESLSNIYFKSRISHIHSLSLGQMRSEQLLYTVEQLDEAIDKNLQVTFTYCDYKSDKRKYKRLSADGKVRTYLINPYQMAVANAKYYLICNNNKHDGLAYYRLDRITDIKLTETRAKPLTAVIGENQQLDLPRHLAEHIYMFAGQAVRVEFEINLNRVGDVIDWFGFDVSFFEENEERRTVRATVFVNEQAMFCWAMQYSQHIKILSPASLVEKLRIQSNKLVVLYQEAEK